MNFQFKSEIAAPFFFGLSGLLLFFSINLFPLAVVSFACAVFALIYSISRSLIRVYHWRTKDMYVALLFTGFAISHAVGIFLPEVGFDALWYHLPLTQVFLSLHKEVFIAELYQSAMPHLGSLIYSMPFFAAQEFGVKLFCYLVTLSLPLYLYRIGRKYLPRTWALLTALIFFAFHTVAWQASSAYVDQLRTMFELTALIVIFHPMSKKSTLLLVIAGALIGFSLSTKLAGLFFLPAFAWLLYAQFGLKKAAISITAALFVAAPWYLRSYLWTGNPFYPLFQTAIGIEQLHEIGVQSWVMWIVQCGVKFLFLPLYLTAHKESFTTLVYAFSVPFLLIAVAKLQKVFGSVIAFTFIGFLGWFAIPPLSVRYALTFFATALVICMYAIWQRAYQQIWTKRIITAVIVISVCVSAALRLGSNLEAVNVLRGKMSAQTYISQQTNGIGQGPAYKWYSGYWKTWTPPQD